MGKHQRDEYGLRHRLGLPIVETIAEAHGGKISVASTVGAGTTFTVELPVHPAPDTLVIRTAEEKEAATT